MVAGIGELDKETAHGGKEREDLLDNLGLGQKGRGNESVVCCRAEDETGVLHFRS